MSNALLLLPDFLLIAIGFVLCRASALDAPVWEVTERLVYYLLFPVLLFSSILKTSLTSGGTGPLALAALGTMVTGIVLALALGRWPGMNARRHASGAQTAYRFNSFIGLAVAERIGGAQGVAWMALCIAATVPIANVAAVWPLSRQGGHSYGRELLRNPLILSTVAGVCANLVGLRLPEPVAVTLQHMGQAALPLGLMATGAGLLLGSLRASPGLTISLIGLRHLVLPAVAIGLTAVLGLPPQQRLIVVMFAALPTSSSAYVLASRMGGDGGYVAGLVTVSTLLGMVSLPAWLAVLAILH